MRVLYSKAKKGEREVLRAKNKEINKYLKELTALMTLGERDVAR
jgi:hypothetical protein